MAHSQGKRIGRCGWLPTNYYWPSKKGEAVYNRLPFFMQCRFLDEIDIDSMLSWFYGLLVCGYSVLNSRIDRANVANTLCEGLSDSFWFVGCDQELTNDRVVRKIGGAFCPYFSELAVQKNLQPSNEWLDWRSSVRIRGIIQSQRATPCS